MNATLPTYCKMAPASMCILSRANSPDVLHALLELWMCFVSSHRNFFNKGKLKRVSTHGLQHLMSPDTGISMLDLKQKQSSTLGVDPLMACTTASCAVRVSRQDAWDAWAQARRQVRDAPKTSKEPERWRLPWLDRRADSAAQDGLETETEQATQILEDSRNVLKLMTRAVQKEDILHLSQVLSQCENQTSTWLPV